MWKSRKNINEFFVKKKTAIKKWSLGSFFIIILSLIFYDNSIFFLRPIYFKKIQNNLYVSNSASDSSIKELRKQLSLAKERNLNFFGSEPEEIDMYFLGDKKMISLFSKKSSFALSITTPFYNYIVINYDGLNVDILSHELCHAIFYMKLGFLKWFKQKILIPTWFDEGLALQVDFRSVFDFKKYNIDSSLVSEKHLFEIDKFYYSDKILGENYIISKQVVANWLKTHALNDLIKAINKGKSFQKAYLKTK